MSIKKSLLRLLNWITPKDEKMILFSSNPDFSDNSEAVFNTMRKDCRFSDYKFVWITRSSSLSKYKGTKCYKVYSPMSFWAYFRAKYVFTTHGIYDGIGCKSQINIGLWHGMPLKSLGSYSANSETFLKLTKYEKRDFTYMIATSPLYQQIMAKCFNMHEEKIIVSGQPRNDELMQNNDSLEKLSIPVRRKTICWLPTYRDPTKVNKAHLVYNQGKHYDNGIPLISEENLKELNEFLKTLSINLVVKIHGSQKFDRSKIPVTENIFFITNENLSKSGVQLYEMLACSDALITDYSSVYIDYMATDKPMAFVIDDIDEYGTDRGFVFENPLDYMPGMKVKDQISLKSFIKSVSEDRDEYKDSRKIVRPKLNIFTDDKNTQRVIDFVFGCDMSGKR